MKKLFTYALMLLVGASLGAVQANAETAASQRMTNKITQKVQNSKKVVKMKAIPQKAFAPAYLSWWNDNALQHDPKLHYTQEGQTSNRLNCYAILCNYKDEKDVGVVTLALDKRCIDKMSDWNGSDFFVFEVKLGAFGQYKSTDSDSEQEEPYFSMTVNNNKQDISRVFFYTTAKNGTTFYTFNMPIRSPELKKNLKAFFAKNGTISMDRAGNGLRMMKDPKVASYFFAY